MIKHCSKEENDNLYKEEESPKIQGWSKEQIEVCLVALRDFCNDSYRFLERQEKKGYPTHPYVKTSLHNAETLRAMLALAKRA